MIRGAPLPTFIRLTPEDLLILIGRAGVMPAAQYILADRRDHEAMRDKLVWRVRLKEMENE